MLQGFASKAFLVVSSVAYGVAYDFGQDRNPKPPWRLRPLFWLPTVNCLIVSAIGLPAKRVVPDFFMDTLVARQSPRPSAEYLAHSQGSIPAVDAPPKADLSLTVPSR